jgi:hypothetical protein
VFCEHVAAEPGRRLRRFQRMVRGVWRRLGDGCRPDRETWQAVEAAGFARVDYEQFDIKVPIFRPHILGAGVKA